MSSLVVYNYTTTLHLITVSYRPLCVCVCREQDVVCLLIGRELCDTSTQLCGGPHARCWGDPKNGDVEVGFPVANVGFVRG